VTDVYVYYFMRSRGPAGEMSRSKRRATLETIKNMGTPVMESQIVVDYTEVDENGFLIGGVGDELHPWKSVGLRSGRWKEELIHEIARRGN
jgi:hypothetical protein